MAPLKSIDMPPRTEGISRIFLESQFCGKPQWPPKSTDLSGQTIIVTGGGSGLGFHACKHLLGYKLTHLIMAVRSTSKGETAAAPLRREYPGAKIDVWELEMSSYSSIQAFTHRVETELTRLDVAILNSGIVSVEFGLNPSTGHENDIQVNYLSTILLAILLLPSLKTKSPTGSPGRLTIVSSGLAYQSQFTNSGSVPLLPSFDTTEVMRWDPGERYATSKLLQHLVLPKLTANINPDEVIVNLVDPGFCKGTGLHRDAHGMIKFILSTMKTLTGRTLEVGSSTYVDASVVKGKESHGCFVMDWSIKPFANMVYDPKGAPVIDRLWDETMAELEFARARSVLQKL